MVYMSSVNNAVTFRLESKPPHLSEGILDWKLNETMNAVIMLNLCPDLFCPWAKRWTLLYYELCLRGWEIKLFILLF